MKRKIIIAAALIIGIAIIFLQAGWLDINLYKSQLGGGQTIALHKNVDSKKSYSFNLTFKDQDKILGQHIYDDGKSSQTDIECWLQEVVYSGNYRLPFYKAFKVKYKCDITTVKSDSGINVKGTVQGDINARIIGLCTTRKAKDIIIKEITKSVMNSLPNTLRN